MRILFSASSLIFSLLLVCCAHTWDSELGKEKPLEWPEIDRTAFLRDSPWAVSDSVSVLNWGSDTRAELEVTAQFLTPFFVERRTALKQIARTRDWMDVQPMITFDDAISVNTFFRDGQILVKGQSRYPLEHKLLFPSVQLPDKIGLFPSGPDWLDSFHDHLQLERTRFKPLDMLEDRLDFENAYYIDLYFMPFIKSHRPGFRIVNPVRCFNCVIGNILSDGVRLLRDDGEELEVQSVVVLWHDIDDVWRKAVWMRGKSTALGIPVAARLIFARKSENGVWLEKTKKARLELAVPPAQCRSFSKNDSGMIWKSILEFDLENMALTEKNAVEGSASKGSEQKE